MMSTGHSAKNCWKFLRVTGVLRPLETILPQGISSVVALGALVGTYQPVTSDTSTAKDMVRIHDENLQDTKDTLILNHLSGKNSSSQENAIRMGPRKDRAVGEGRDGETVTHESPHPKC